MRIESVVAALCAMSGVALAVTVNVDSKAVIFDAGRASTTPGLGGILPPGLSLPAGVNRYIEFSSVTGEVGFGLDASQFPPTDPDGYDYPSGMDISSLNGVSGMRGPRYAFLAGVFLSNAQPSDPAPARMDFWVSDFGGATFSPSLNQSFYIGDGLTGRLSGATQRYYVPDDATRVFFGILDAGGVVGSPGMYGDNFGAYEATFTVAPAPSSLAVGAVAIRGLRRRR